MTTETQDTILWLWSYQDWATPRILAAAQSLSNEDRIRPGVIAGGLGKGSLHDVLEHITGAEQIWLRRFSGDFPREMPSYAGLDELAGVWTRLADERRTWLQTLDGETLAGDFHYERFDGSAQDLPLWQTLLHCSNHTTLHREDACTALTRLGAPPETVDMIDFIRQAR